MAARTDPGSASHPLAVKIIVPVSLGMSVPGVIAGAGQGWCLVAPGDS